MSTTISILNKVASQALRGQNIKITVDLSAQSVEFNQLKVGQLLDSGGGGVVYSIDTYGNTFEICPLQPNFNLSDAANGYFAADASVDIIVN